MSQKNTPRHRWLGALTVAALALLVGLLTRPRRQPPPEPPPPTPPLPPADPSPPPWVVAGFSLGFVGLVLVLPRRVAGWVLVGAVGLALLALVWRVALPQVRRLFAYRARLIPQTHTPPASGLRRVPWGLVLVELGLVLALALAPTARFWLPDANTQLGGHEAQWLTSSGRVATDTLYRYGYIPLWNPYNDHGEPLIDNPFGYVLNPISAGPSLLLGDSDQGVKTSVALYAALAALGGWFLGRMLNMGSFGRLLLAALLLGKGNMVAMITDGYFQLGVTQAYIPWIIGAAVGVIRLPRARWPLVLLALSFTLMLWAGNIWYTLPSALSVGVLWLAWDYRSAQAAPNRWRTLRRFGGAALLTIGLSAAVLLPVFAKRGYIGGHKPLVNAGDTAPIARTLAQFVQPDADAFGPSAPDGFEAKFHYSYTTNRYFLLLLFVLVPPLYPVTGRAGFAGGRRLWWVALGLAVFFIGWGLGGLQPFRWAYNTLPGLGRWRFVGRALAMASFWLAVLVAFRADGLLTALLNRDGQPYQVLPPRVARLLAGLLLLAGGAAAYQSTTIWGIWDGLAEREIPIETCVSWLRGRSPDEPLAVYRTDYKEVAAMHRQRVRISPIEADYFALPRALGPGENLILENQPAFAVPRLSADVPWLTRDYGYRRMESSPYILGDYCLMQRPDALPFAFSASFSLIEETDITSNGLTTPLALLDYRPGYVTVRATPLPDRESAAVVQEVAYPGWRAWVDNAPAEITPVGGYLAVTLPPGEGAVTVRFAYRPRWFIAGVWVTLVSAGVSVGLLLHKPRR